MQKKKENFKMCHSFCERVESVHWREFETAYGNALEIPRLLIQLPSKEKHIWFSAVEKLDAGLCHQAAYVSSAALPAFPFILEAMEATDCCPKIADILEIFLGFAVCVAGTVPAPSGWKLDLQNELMAALPKFLILSGHVDDDIAFFASKIVSLLAN